MAEYRESATPDYTMGFGEEILETLRRYRAQTHAAHLLPHLRPGLKVLDVGCGPGTISVGLAEAVTPGELHGVDMEESQIALARMFAHEGGHSNAVFHLGDATALAFEDGIFDVVHCHNVLMHIPDTAAALGEVKRVLKTGGIISCREMICESSFTHPDLGIMKQSWEMFQDLLTADDGHPQMGKEVYGHLLKSGFSDPRVSCSWDTYSTPDEVEFIYNFTNRWFLSPEVTEAAIKYGAGTARLAEAIRVGYDRWRYIPGAFVALAYGEVIAIKP